MPSIFQLIKGAERKFAPVFNNNAGIFARKATLDEARQGLCYEGET